MHNKRKKVKIFSIYLSVLFTILMIIQIFVLTPPNFSSSTKFSSNKIFISGNIGGSGGDDNKIVISELSKIFGTIFVPIDNSKTQAPSIDELVIPLENSTVAIMYIENNLEIITAKNSKVWKATITNENGTYLFDLLKPGEYEIRASKQGYLETTKKINLDKNQSVKLDFILEKTSSENFSSSENITKIIAATKTGFVGGQINIWQDENKTFDHEILIFDSLNISKLDVEKGILSFTVSGNESATGKTISLNVDSNVFNAKLEILVKYDGESINMADGITDVLNPNDDGSNPEYIITKGASGIQILLSIPHFSEHEITIFGLTEEIIDAIGGVNAAILYIVICIAASVVFIGSIYIRRKI